MTPDRIRSSDWRAHWRPSYSERGISVRPASVYHYSRAPEQEECRMHFVQRQRVLPFVEYWYETIHRTSVCVCACDVPHSVCFRTDDGPAGAVLRERRRHQQRKG